MAEILNKEEELQGLASAEEERKNKELWEYVKSPQTIKVVEDESIVSLWDELFSKASVCNEIPGKILLHSLFGSKLYKKRIYTFGGDYIDWRVHFIHIQDSRSGKNKGTEFALEGARKLGVKNAKISANETEASLLDDFEQNKDGRYTGKIVKGILSINEIVYFEEARALLEPGKYNENLKEIFMAVSEPYGSEHNKYPRKLKGYSTTLDIQSPATIIATTRPLLNLRGYLLYAGILQRALSYPRKLNNTMRNKMLLEKRKELFGEYGGDKKENLIGMIKRSVEFAEKNEFSVGNVEVSRRLIENFEEEMAREVNGIGNEEHREILHSFLGEYTNHIVKIAHHHSAMRLSSVVNERDFKYAIDLCRSVFNQLVEWVGMVVKEDFNITKDRENRINMVKRQIGNADNKKITIQTLSTILHKMWGIAYNSAKEWIENHQGAGYRIDDDVVTLGVRKI